MKEKTVHHKQIAATAPPQTPPRTTKKVTLAEESPLSKEAEKALRKQLEKHVTSDHQRHIQDFFEELIRNPSPGSLFFPDPLGSSLRLLQNMVAQFGAFKTIEPVIQEWLSTQCLSDLRSALQTAWDPETLKTTCLYLEIQTQKDSFVRVQLSHGKVIWTVFWAETNQWLIPSKARGRLQHDQVLVPAPQQAPPNPEKLHVDMTFADFIVFKNAGKRQGSAKKSVYETQPVLDRHRENRLAQGSKVWDVAAYNALPKKTGLNVDHIPQDKWLLKAYYDYPACKALEDCVTAIRTDGIDKVKKAIRDFNKEAPNMQAERKNGLFPITQTPAFQAVYDTVTHTAHFTKAQTAALTTGLVNVRQIPYGWTNTYPLKTYAEEVSTSAITIAIPTSMHKESRTFSLDGKITDERRGSSIIGEISLDTTHYCTHEKTRSYITLEALGAFRYLLRQNLKKYALTQRPPDSPDAHTCQQLETHILGMAKTLTTTTVKTEQLPTSMPL